MSPSFSDPQYFIVPRYTLSPISRLLTALSMFFQDLGTTWVHSNILGLHLPVLKWLRNLVPVVRCQLDMSPERMNSPRQIRLQNELRVNRRPILRYSAIAK